VFRSYDPDELLMTTWTIVSVATEDTIESVLDGTEPTLTFIDDGDVSMETGCNTATSTWELDCHALSIGAVGITQMSCDSPEDVMDQRPRWSPPSKPPTGRDRTGRADRPRRGRLDHARRREAVRGPQQHRDDENNQSVGPVGDAITAPPWVAHVQVGHRSEQRLVVTTRRVQGGARKRRLTHS